MRRCLTEWFLAFWVILIAFVFAWALATDLSGATVPEEFSLSGRFTATDQEADEGYFVFGSGQTAILIAVRPTSELHGFFRSHLNKPYEIVFHPRGDADERDNRAQRLDVRRNVQDQARFGLRTLPIERWLDRGRGFLWQVEQAARAARER